MSTSHIPELTDAPHSRLYAKLKTNKWLGSVSAAEEDGKPILILNLVDLRMESLAGQMVREFEGIPVRVAVAK